MPKTYQRDQPRISVSAGEAFVIELVANPTTGHEWQPVYDPARLELLGREFAAAGAAMGEGGVERFRFRAKAGGATRLGFIYRRPWDSGAPADEVAFELVVD